MTKVGDVFVGGDNYFRVTHISGKRVQLVKLIERNGRITGRVDRGERPKQCLIDDLGCIVVLMDNGSMCLASKK